MHRLSADDHLQVPSFHGRSLAQDKALNTPQLNNSKEQDEAKMRWENSLSRAWALNISSARSTIISLFNNQVGPT